MQTKESKRRKSVGSNCAGKYFLDEIDGIVYSTDDYWVYNYYNAIFRDTVPGYPKGYSGFQEKKENKNECTAMATPEAWKKGIEQEVRSLNAKKRYEILHKRRER